MSDTRYFLLCPNERHLAVSHVSSLGAPAQWTPATTVFSLCGNSRRQNPLSVTFGGHRHMLTTFSHQVPLLWACFEMTHQEEVRPSLHTQRTMRSLAEFLEVCTK